MGEMVLITGAAGFIGARTVASALRAGYRVRALIRPGGRSLAALDSPSEVKVVDFGDERGLAESLKGVSAVVHLAGLTRARDEREFLRANAEAVGRLARIAAGEGVGRFVYISSLAAAGPSQDGRPVDELTEPKPVSAYGRSKLAGEQFLRANSGSMPTTIIRPPAVYGPGDRDVFLLFRTAARRGFVPVIGSGRRTLSFVYVDDLAAGILAALPAQAAVGKTYNICHPEVLTFADVAKAIAVAAARPCRPIRVPEWVVAAAALGGSLVKPFLKRPPLTTLDKLKEILAPHWVASPARARTDFGFEAATPFSEGARATVKWGRDAGLL